MSNRPKAVLLDKDTFGPDQPDWSSILSTPFDWHSYGHTSPEQVMERIEDAQVVMSNKVVLDEHILKQAKGLKYIGVLATGTNNVDKVTAAQLGIKVQNVEGYGTASVVQHTFMLMLNLATNAQAYQKAVKDGAWSRSSMFCLLDYPVVELAGKHLVIVGYGELGRSVANIASAFGMRVSVAARPGTTANGSDGIAREPLESLLPDADFVSLHCLLSDDTHHMINASRLAMMKPTSFLINTARGPLVDEDALADALLAKTIAGAGLDVLSQEPPDKDNPLLDLTDTNLVITPHNAWATAEARQRLVDIAGQHLNTFC